MENNSKKEGEELNLLRETDVLIIEDEEIVGTLIERYLEDYQEKNPSILNLKRFSSGWDLMNADLSNVKVAIVDILLPQINGVDLIKHFSKKFPTMGFVPITGMATQPLRRRLKEYLNDEMKLIDKPLRKDEFYQAFKTAWNYDGEMHQKTALNPFSQDSAENSEEKLWNEVQSNEATLSSIPIVKRRLSRSKKEAPDPLPDDDE